MNYETCLAKALALELNIRLTAEKVGVPTNTDLSDILEELYQKISTLKSSQLSFLCTKEDLILIKLGVYLRNIVLVRQQVVKDKIIPASLELSSAIQYLFNNQDIDQNKIKEISRNKIKDGVLAFSSFEDWANEQCFTEISCWLDLSLTVINKWNWWESCLSMVSL